MAGAEFLFKIRTVAVAHGTPAAELVFLWRSTGGTNPSLLAIIALPATVEIISLSTDPKEFSMLSDFLGYGAFIPFQGTRNLGKSLPVVEHLFNILPFLQAKVFVFHLDPS